MSRAKWKNPFIKSLKKNDKNKKKTVILNRNYEITPSIVGHTYQVYNGKLLMKLLITDEMIGHKSGEFIPTREKFVFKKKRKKSK